MCCYYCGSGTSSGYVPLASAPSATWSALDIYKRFLKTTYSYQSMPTYLKPDVTHGAKTYINLALVHRGEETERKWEESVMHQLHGNVDMMTKVRTPLDLKDIGWIRRYLSKEKIRYKSCTADPCEGSPTCGKTTLTWYLFDSGRRESSFSNGRWL